MLPILYSFRRCPYAIRARLALKYSGIRVELREVILADKPEDMLNCSPKGTVPVLKLADGTILDESLDIINWALSHNDPDGWLVTDAVSAHETCQLIEINDGPFKEHLDQYKYAVRFPEHPVEYYREQAEDFLDTLNNLLRISNYLFGAKLSIADIAIFPFIRQFSFVDKEWFDNSEYQHLASWLDSMLEMKLFMEIMKKYPRWKPGDELIVF